MQKEGRQGDYNRGRGTVPTHPFPAQPCRCHCLRISISKCRGKGWVASRTVVMTSLVEMVS